MCRIDENIAIVAVVQKHVRVESYDDPREQDGFQFGIGELGSVAGQFKPLSLFVAHECGC